MFAFELTPPDPREAADLSCSGDHFEEEPLPSTRPNANAVDEPQPREAGSFRNPLHDWSQPTVAWTTVNTQEGFPGVPTPLTWTVVGTTAFQESARQAFYAIGALRRSLLARPSDVSKEFIGIFYGRASCNLTMWRAIGDAMPGSSPAAIEAQIFGVEEVLEDLPSHPDWARYPVVLVKFPVAARRALRELQLLDAETAAWWRSCLADRAHDREALAGRTAEAAALITRIATPHLVVTMVGQAVYERIRVLAHSVGKDGLETTVMSGWDLDETRTLTDLWAVSRNALSLDDFLAVHGYHGPAEGELSSRTWREDPGPLNALIKKYAAMSDSAEFVAKKAERNSTRALAEAELLESLNAAKRAYARVLLRVARAFVPMRETGRNTFLKAIDVARFTARDLGAAMVKDGVFESPEDVFYLCLDELASPPADARSLVVARRATCAEYEAYQVPSRWVGEPIPVEVTSVDDVTEIKGMGVSPGVIEGRARVVLNGPDSEEMEEGEILVCKTTDPSWAAYFFIAGGVVIDIGGALSHGAIVAREVGLPCVINARTATSQLKTGDLLRVDGNTGQVTVLERNQTQ